ncbi:stage III sporulation protein AA [Oceanobacillus sp. APA_J-2(6-2)]|nr:stage III sporulation protein AA [Oceanobacillus alkalisoli]
MMEEILRIFPPEMKGYIALKIGKRWDKLEEIRCRLHQPVELIFEDQVEWITTLIPDKKTGVFLLNQLSEFSLYRMENELREGFITIEGGHRVGIAGKVNTLDGSVKAVQNISFFNIRIARQKLGVAEALIQNLYTQAYENTLIIGPPQSGKTTLIRDITRLVSTGWKDKPGRKVAVIDERSEIGAAIQGIPQHDLGRRTDVMDGCPKAEGMMMMIRSMSPEVLVVDEVGGNKDIHAIHEAVHSGVTVVCSIHGQSLEDLKKRTALRELMQARTFKRFIILGKRTAGRQKIQIFNEEGKQIQSRGVGWK